MADILGIDAELALAADNNLYLERKVYRPGAVRISFPWFYSDATVDYIIGAVAWITERGWQVDRCMRCALY